MQLNTKKKISLNPVSSVIIFVVSDSANFLRETNSRLGLGVNIV